MFYLGYDGIAKSNRVRACMYIINVPMWILWRNCMIWWLGYILGILTGSIAIMSIITGQFYIGIAFTLVTLFVVYYNGV